MITLLGFCAEKAGIKPKNFHLFHDKPYENVCEVVGMITRHEIVASEMKSAYDAIMSSNFSCPGPTQYTKLDTIKKPNEIFCVSP